MQKLGEKMSNKKEIMELFKDLSDEQTIIDTLYEFCISYNTLSLSEEKAKKWLKRYGVVFYYQHQEIKNIFKKLLFYAKIKGIKIPFSLDINDCTEEDVINRMLENAALIGSKFEDSNVKENLDLINSFYDGIIKEYQKRNEQISENKIR